MAKENKGNLAKDIEDDLTSYKDKIKEKKKEVKVEFKGEKEDSNIFKSIINWIVGLYLLGMIITLTGYGTDYTYNFVISVILENFFKLELDTFAAILANPVIIILTVIPIISVGFALYGLLYFSVKKLNVFSEKQEKVYLALSFLITLFTISTYF